MNKAQMKAEATARAERRIIEHIQLLKKLSYMPDDLTPLIKLENRAHKIAEQECNGEISEKYAAGQYAAIQHSVNCLFEKSPEGFFINTDPRGYALKINDDTMRANNIELFKDWGGYGILAPDIMAEELAWLNS